MQEFQEENSSGSRLSGFFGAGGAFGSKKGSKAENANSKNISSRSLTFTPELIDQGISQEEGDKLNKSRSGNQLEGQLDYQEQSYQFQQEQPSKIGQEQLVRKKTRTESLLQGGAQSTINNETAVSNKENMEDDDKKSFSLLKRLTMCCKIKSAEFQFHQSKKPTEYDIRSLFIFHGSWRIRKWVVWLIQWKYFDTFIINLIIANSIMLACADYGERLYGPDYVSVRNLNIGVVDDAFTILFLCECILKIFAMGFILHKNSYMRDKWNWLDIFVVSVSVVLWLPQLEGNQSVKILRIFRILRPLRSIKQLPTMKKLVKTLIACVFGLFNVILFMLFVFTMFAIFGSHQFVGDQYNACRTTKEPYLVGNNTYEWPINPTAIWLCNEDSDCARQLGPKAIAKCGNWFDYKMSIELDHPLENEQIFFNVPKFDNVLWSLIAIYQCVTMEGWTLLMYNYMDADNYWIPQIYFVGLIFVCCFFGMQLVLAQIMETFIQQKLELEKEELEAIEKEQERQEMERQVIDAMVSGDSDKLDGMKERYEQEGKLKQNMPISPIKKRAKTTADEVKAEVKQADKNKTKNITPNPNLLSISSIEEKEQIEQEQQEIQSAFQDEIRIDLLNSEDLFNDKETAYELASRLRSGKNVFYRSLYNFVMHPLYNLAIFLLILANTITLASDDYPQSFQKEETLSNLNDFFTWAFTFEMLLKMMALGFKNYMRDRFNMFDCVVVIFSIIDFTIGLVQKDSNSSSSFLQAFRALRLLRVVKVVRRWKKLQEIIGKIMLSFNDILNFSVLLFLFLYIYALLGMELFANRAYYTDKTFTTAIPADQVVQYVASGKSLVHHNYNFDNLYNAMITCFCVIVQEDWNNNMYNFIRGNPDSQYVTIAFFIALNASGGYLMLNLFTGILLQNFDSADSNEDPQSAVDKSKQTFNFRKYLSLNFLKEIWFKILSFFDDRKFKQKIQQESPQEQNKQVGDSSISPNQGDAEQQMVIKGSADSAGQNTQIANLSDKILSKQKSRRNTELLHYDAVEDIVIEEDKNVKTIIQQKIQGKSVFIFPHGSKIRVVMGIVAEHRYFERFILLLIGISTVQLAVVTPLDDPKGKKIAIVGYIDYVMTGFFVCEMITKVIAYGFAFCGKNSYIRSPWNILDFIIVVSALASIIFIDVNLGFIKSLRVLRVLRPLRLIAKNKGLKLAVITIFRSLPPIFNLLLIMWFCLFLMSILSLTLFKGQFYHCETGHLGLTQQQIEKGIITRYDCLSYGGEWTLPNDMHFDNIVSSFLTHIGIQSTEGWCDIMWLQIQVAGIEYQPKYDSQRYYCIYSIFCVLFTTILFLNLFVGVVIETFNTEKEILSLNRLLRAIEKVWIDVQLMNYKAKPLVKVSKSGDKIRDLMIGISQNKVFDNIILLCILANTVILSIVFFGMSEKINQQLENANLVFTVIFTVEAIIKIIAMRKHYFRSAWNNFDFGVVVITWIVQIIVFSSNTINLKILGTIVRTLRICRVFRLANRAPQLQIILKTVMEALPAVSSLATLMGLLFFLYAIVGMSQFALIINQDQMDDYHVNFKDIGRSLLLLMRCTTGEAWDSIMFNLARPYSILNQCNQNPDYDSYIANGHSPDGCGTKISFLYFYSFIVIVIQMFLNLFIAVIIDSYLNQSEAFSLPVTQNDVDEFVDTWQLYDSEGIGSIKSEDLEKFIISLASRKTNLITSRKRMQSNHDFRRKFIAGLAVPIHHDLTQFLFYDVLQCLSRAICENAYGLERLKEKKLMAFASKQNSVKGKADQLKQNIENVFSRDYELDFRDVVTGITNLDHQIESVDVLRKSVKQITRRPQGKLCKAVDAEEFYTSKHYIYGCLIVNCWREYLKVQDGEKKAVVEQIEPVPGLKKSKTSYGANKAIQNIDSQLAQRVGSGIVTKFDIKSLFSPKNQAQAQEDLLDESDSISASSNSNIKQ